MTDYKNEEQYYKDTDRYDKVFNLLAGAEMALRNKEYWSVANHCELASKIAKEFAKEDDAIEPTLYRFRGKDKT